MECVARVCMSAAASTGSEPPQEEFRGSHGPRHCAPHGDPRLLSSQRGPSYLWGLLSIPSKRSRSRQPRRRAVHPVATRGSRPAAPGPLGCALSAKPEDTRIRLRPREGKKLPPDARGQEKSRQTYLQSSQIPGSWADNMAQDNANFLDLGQLAKFAS